MEVEKIIKKIIEKELENIGYKLESVTYEKEGNTNFLKIVIDKEGYITIEDCVKAHNLVSPLLDKEDPIEESYMLDISSKEKGKQENE